MTTIPDDFSVLRSTAFAGAIVKFEELTTQSRRAFLLGAGASYCAGLPLLADLTKLTLTSAKLQPEDKAILEGLQTNFAGATQPNIEDYLSELIDLLAISERRMTRNATVQTALIGGVQYTAKQPDASNSQSSNLSALLPA